MGQTSPPALAQPVFEHVAGTSVADIGCGSGLFGYMLRVAWHFTGSWKSEQIPAPQMLVGVDFSPVAIERLRQFNIYNELVLADAATLPLPDASVDTALSMENVEHLFPAEIVPALRELARIARRRVVLSTPAPWTVVNRAWLRHELTEAELDPIPIGYEEFLVLAGCIHKTVIIPEIMHHFGFQVATDRGQPTQIQDSLIYWADPAALLFDDTRAIPGIALSEYPADDGRSDWREEYVRFLRASQAIDTSKFPPPKRSLGRRALSAAAQVLRG